MPDWRFYGREEELAKVRRSLQLSDPDGRVFVARVLLGRRGIGKSALLAEAAKGLAAAPPFLTVQLPEGGREDCLDAIVAEIRKAGLGPLMDDMPADPLNRWSTANAQGRFTDIVSHLIEQGVVVCLDEFHNARNASIESPLKLMIDHFVGRPLSGTKRPPGKLVLTGSHQQHLLRMLQSDAPLHLRTTPLLLLRQWPLSTTFEMAAEQGLLARPGRFLTLWTAYGGLPHRWERVATDPDFAAVRDPAALPDDREWRLEFLRAEREALAGRFERVDDKVIIELSKDLRAALIWMSRQSARGGTAGEIAAGAGVDGKRMDKALLELESHLELVRFDQPRFIGPNLWRIADNNTLFQLGVFRDLYPRDPRVRRPVSSAEQLTWLENLEGRSLERLAEEWLAGRPGADPAEGGWVESGVCFRGPSGVREIDAAALLRQENGVKLILADCTRGARAHEPGRAAELFGAFLDFLAETGLLRQMKDANKIFRLLIAPVFSDDERERIERDGTFVACDIPQMALKSGVSPALLPSVRRTVRPRPSAQTKPDPELDNSPDFGM